MKHGYDEGLRCRIGNLNLLRKMKKDMMRSDKEDVGEFLLWAVEKHLRLKE